MKPDESYATCWLEFVFPRKPLERAIEIIERKRNVVLDGDIMSLWNLGNVN